MDESSQKAYIFVLYHLYFTGNIPIAIQNVFYKGILAKTAAWKVSQKGTGNIKKIK